MSNITTFDDLPIELIICIFHYLEPAENFQSFFHYNDHIRKLVKRYVSYSSHALDKDIERFSTLHSWYKHLNYNDGGVTFYIVPLKGEQERYNFSPWVSDLNGIHWHFWRQKNMPLVDKRIEEISRKYPIKLNPSFHPQGEGNILFRDGPDIIRQYHPEQYEILSTTLFSKPFTNFFELRKFYTDDIQLVMKSIYENERKRLRNLIKQAAYLIWKEIQTLEDVNILEIQYSQQTAGFVMCMTLEQFYQSQSDEIEST